MVADLSRRLFGLFGVLLGRTQIPLASCGRVEAEQRQRFGATIAGAPAQLESLLVEAGRLGPSASRVREIAEGAKTGKPPRGGIGRR